MDWLIFMAGVLIGGLVGLILGELQAGLGKCSTCRGSGKVPLGRQCSMYPVTEADLKRYETLVTCHHCNGTGGHPDNAGRRNYD